MLILFTVLCSLILGVVIAFTYEKTSRTPDRPDHFLQALVLITIVAATIMQAIGDSVARGLGMLGALSIIRFRTTVRNPRNIVFMFSAIAAGIACGVFGFIIAAVGTIGFCLTAFLLRFSSFSKKDTLLGVLKIECSIDGKCHTLAEREINRYAKKFILIRKKLYVSEKKSNVIRFEYQVKMKEVDQAGDLLKAITAQTDIRVIDFEFQNQTVNNI